MPSFIHSFNNNNNNNNNELIVHIYRHALRSEWPLIIIIIPYTTAEINTSVPAGVYLFPNPRQRFAVRIWPGTIQVSRSR